MILKRVFHPIGQGAFFTEQFFDEATDELLYNVVYDCGSLSKAIKSQIRSCIKSVFHDKKTVDVLFISHFDDDHVKYIDSLLEFGCLEGTKIFIPELWEEKWIKLCSYWKNYNYIAMLDENTPRGRRVIRVAIDDRKDDQLSEELNIEELTDKMISSGVRLKLGLKGKDIWYYVPFNYRFNEVIDIFKKRLEEYELSFDLLKDDAFIIRNMRKLKSVYSGLGKDPRDGTAINFNSLQLLSYPAKMEMCKKYGRRTNCDSYFPDAYRWNLGLTAHMMCKENIYPASCLYTGDTSANYQMVWDRMCDVIKKYLGKKLALYQIPHHGSRYSNDDKVMDFKMFYAAFTNYDPFYQTTIFDDRLPMKYAMLHKPLILVTQEYNSQFEEYWMLG